MNASATPAARPTAASIARSFQISGKACLRLCGADAQSRRTLAAQVLCLSGAGRSVFYEDACEILLPGAQGDADSFCVDLDRPFARIGCVVMASGEGRRFGGGKLLAPLGEKPLIRWALDAVQDLFPRRIAVTRDPAIKALCREMRMPVLLHSLPLRSDTVRLGLEALTAQEGLSSCIFLPADQPLITQETLETMALVSAAFPRHILRAAWQDTPGSPVLFPACCFEALAHLPAGKGGSAVVRAHGNRVILVPAKDAQELMDVDYPEDLRALNALLRED